MYKVLILGWKINEWKQSHSVFQALSYNVYLAFKKNVNVEVEYYDKNHEDLPLADFVILITYISDEIDVEKIRDKTKAKKICSLRENGSDFDFAFVFNSSFQSKNSFTLPPSCNKSLLNFTPKEEKSILIDHYWEPYLNTCDDMTFQIEEWLESENRPIYRLIRFEGEEKKIKSFEQPIFYSDYLTYLDRTSHIETFILTHKESYSYGVIDMAARGTRILVPLNYIPECLVNDLKIPLFQDKETFFKELHKPITDDEIQQRINACVDFSESVKIIDEYFRSWINE